jgi:hypothetical protein
LIIAVRFIKKIPEGQEKCEDGKMKCNMENVRKGHIIHSTQINIRNVNSKYHTTIDHSRSPMKSNVRDNLNIYALCEREVISRNHSKKRSKRIIEYNLYYRTLCGKGLIFRNHTKIYTRQYPYHGSCVPTNPSIAATLRVILEKI